MSNENNGALKFFCKPSRTKMIGLLIVFVWIAIWNIIYQLVHGVWHDWNIQVINWSFFASVTLFFMQEELTYKQRFWHTLVGGSMGLLLAAGVVVVCKALVGAGVDYTTAVIIPMVAVVAVLILAAPCVPMVFNNVGFIYLIVSFVEKETIIANLPSNLISLLLGSIILNLGCTVLLNAYKKSVMKKAKAGTAK